jgi:hypothetical protein
MENGRWKMEKTETEKKCGRVKPIKKRPQGNRGNKTGEDVRWPRSNKRAGAASPTEFGGCAGKK